MIIITKVLRKQSKYEADFTFDLADIGIYF